LLLQPPSFLVASQHDIINYDSFSDLLIAANKVTRTSRFIVAGMVDLDAIPEEKSRVPIGSQDNPVPLVEFIKPSKTPTSVKNSSGKRKKRTKKKHKKRK